MHREWSSYLKGACLYWQCNSKVRPLGVARQVWVACMCVQVWVCVSKRAEWTCMFHSFSLQDGSTREMYWSSTQYHAVYSDTVHTRDWCSLSCRNFCQCKPLQKCKHDSYCSPRGWFVGDECGWYLHFIKKICIASSQLTWYLLGKWRRSALYPPPTPLLVKSEQLRRWS